MEKIIKSLAKELSIREKQVEDTIKLIDEGNTIPFIARYRKEVTGGLSDEILRAFNTKLEYLRNLESRKEDVIRLIEEQGKLTETLEKEIRQAEVLQRVEDLYRPYKQKRKTKGAKAKAKGLGPLAEVILSGQYTGEVEALAKDYLTEEVDTLEEAFDGAMDIIREEVSDNPDFRKFLRSSVYKNGVLLISKKGEDEEAVYEMYYDYTEKVNQIVNHRVLAIDRGEAEDVLSVKIDVDDEYYTKYLIYKMTKDDSASTHKYLVEGVERGYQELLMPAVERDIRRKLTERAQKDAIGIFAKNTKDLLMQAPIEGVTVLAVDPSFRTGCKLAVVDDLGNLLDYKTIYPNEPQNRKKESKKVILDLINKYDIDLIPIGNGTASRETEQFVAESLKSVDKEVYYTIVSEAGASVYSASKLATEEYPDVNVSIRGAISIGRRLQDPLAELVKIDPKSIGVGQYQHDLNQTELNDALTQVVEASVNNVGVDINTASISLLKYVAGISKSVANNILAYKKEHKRFKSRSELKKVKRLGPKTFEQCAGFLRISDGKNILDNTSVHPESYKDTKKLLKMLGYTLDDIKARAIDDIDARVEENGGYLELAEQLDSGVPTLKDIVRELKKPGRDPREEMPKPIFKNDVLKIEDLKEDMILKGTVRNVVDFGAFVDIGLKNDGLVHISELSQRYVNHPLDIVSIGDVVEVKIIGVDLKRKRVSLSMKQI